MKRTIFIILGLILVVIIVLTTTFQGFELKKLSNRPYTPYPLDKELRERIKHDVTSMDDPHTVVRYSCILTSELLSFSQKNNITHGKANCVGYAQLSSSICNYAIYTLSIQMKDESLKQIKARPVVGTVHYAGIDLNKISQYILPDKYKPFFKDHDFMEIDFGNNDIKYVDSCLFDIFGTNI